ncbi:MAG: phosphoribosylformylglycinamidine cyclo-ligase [Cutibacterium granulosum]|uniref:phosphoribosylformylglycinamidine cyclo-ligase n=1 Tax=Cutibacterium granulosum TaxID=33011 RepID=UPI002915BA76|nr:phosphoribosylformylglycinamidine cyclo-ligase [Cutibacterium granulosum]MDU3271991.1 phosphoribosylformylglycinamidine cyclo-ligase [Cutibacterium sp.]MEA5633019.1 phosphoribosylformylglycinamidine cyclo-ligase [Cutibacterium granulosum]MEA5635298.1 phosphoribosylformylglycinamidine cyclo-ligase [Cutibacterium granulosum]MEA5648403.1 phosphoribosylformylglycinamidine cyclo-ligase [Cutibacterium granulosum]MEA5650776.1 phosphoribosylformylglycinamidine cyclo-ligase [Cutibacterium granulosum
MTHETAYARAGVDIAAGDRAVELMKEHVAGTRRPEVLGGLGGFAGFFDAATFKDYRHPVLATSTDGVGTKVDIARRMKVYDTIGFDLMGMLVDDLVVVGAEPLFVTDYISCGHVDPEVIASIVKGIAQACQKAGCALLGGETAEHPGLLAPDEFDVAGATTGVVERDEILGPERIAEGDALIAVASSGLHSNGYSLVRHVLLEQAGWTLDRHVDELGRTVGEELLEPTIVYAADLLALAHHSEVHAMCHVTGGGLANNLTRVMPSHLTATIERSTWSPAPIFRLVQEVGAVSQSDIEETLNMGVGMVIALPDDQVPEALEFLAGRGLTAWQCGTVASRESSDVPAVSLLGGYSMD